MTSTRVPYEAKSDVIDAFVRDHLESNDALYELDVAALEKAAPDFVVSQALCDVCAVSTGDVYAALESLASRPQIIDLEPNTLDEVFADCKRVGESLGQPERAERLYAELERKRAEVADRTATIATKDRPRVAFLEWLEPPFNGGHWNPELIELAGGIDVLGAAGKPSSTCAWPDVHAAEPDIIFVACCGFSAERALQDVASLRNTPAWQNIPAVASGNVIVADGNNFFSRPGPRLMHGLEILAHALHPDVHPVSTYGSCIRVD